MRRCRDLFLDLTTDNYWVLHPNLRQDGTQGGSIWNSTSRAPGTWNNAVVHSSFASQAAYGAHLITLRDGAARHMIIAILSASTWIPLTPWEYFVGNSAFAINFTTPQSDTVSGFTRHLFQASNPEIGTLHRLQPAVMFSEANQLRFNRIQHHADAPARLAIDRGDSTRSIADTTNALGESQTFYLINVTCQQHIAWRVRDVGTVILASVNDDSGYYTATEIESATRYSDLGLATLQNWLQGLNGAREHILALNNGFNYVPYYDA